MQSEGDMARANHSVRERAAYARVADNSMHDKVTDAMEH